MQKRLISEVTAPPAPLAQRLPVEAIEEVEVTSEAPGFPIEAALGVNPPAAGGGGWRAGSIGPQVIRLKFAEPVNLARIHVEFDEVERLRTHEFVLRWSPDGGADLREIVRQQFTFAPPHGATREAEEYRVQLRGVRVLELTIVPDIGGGPAIASLSAWWLERMA